MVPVSFETVVTETGMLQLWCVARDGRRWKLEFNVRERVRSMKIGIDLGTTNSALAYIDPREAEDRDFPPIHILRNPAAGGAGTRSSRGARCHRSCSSKTASRVGTLRARAGRAGADPIWCTRRSRGCRIRTWTAPRRSCRGIAGDRARALARRGIGPLSWPIPRGRGTRRTGAHRSPSRTSCSPCRPPSTKRRANSP